MCVLAIKVPIRKKSGNLFNDPRIIDKSVVRVGLSTYFYHLVRFTKIYYFSLYKFVRFDEKSR